MAARLERLPVSVHTLYADLADRAWTGDFLEIAEAGGTPYKRTEKGRSYWYWQPPTINGSRPSARYLGPDSPEVRQRIQEREALADARKDRIELVRALRAARRPVPDGLTGRVVAALAGAEPFTGQWWFLGGDAASKGLPLSTVLLFDIGVYLVVVGSVLTLVFTLEESV